jgi:DNA-binding NarL/FixJ family response regulator
VRVKRAGDALHVDVLNTGGGGGAPSTHGHGIDGMRESAAALGGRLDAGPQPPAASPSGPPALPKGQAGSGRPYVIRVVVVDDQKLVRMGLRTLLETEEDLELIAEAVFEALRAGASGFVFKDAEPEDLVRAMRVVADGGALLSPSVTRKVIEQFAGAVPTRSAKHLELSRLTEREREIVAWVATGRSNDEIAEELVVSPATVRMHISRAMVKLGARDRAQLVVFAIQSGLAV